MAYQKSFLVFIITCSPMQVIGETKNLFFAIWIFFSTLIFKVGIWKLGFQPKP